ncbi:hypothetical protein ADUPG1_000720, partial [Aduncisulcus paluster]
GPFEKDAGMVSVILDQGTNTYTGTFNVWVSTSANFESTSILERGQITKYSDYKTTVSFDMDLYGDPLYIKVECAESSSCGTFTTSTDSWYIDILAATYDELIQDVDVFVTMESDIPQYASFEVHSQLDMYLNVSTDSTVGSITAILCGTTPPMDASYVNVTGCQSKDIGGTGIDTYYTFSILVGDDSTASGMQYLGFFPKYSVTGDQISLSLLLHHHFAEHSPLSISIPVNETVYLQSQTVKQDTDKLILEVSNNIVYDTDYILICATNTSNNPVIGGDACPIDNLGQITKTDNAIVVDLDTTVTSSQFYVSLMYVALSGDATPVKISVSNNIVYDTDYILICATNTSNNPVIGGDACPIDNLGQITKTDNAIVVDLDTTVTSSQFYVSLMYVALSGDATPVKISVSWHSLKDLGDSDAAYNFDVSSGETYFFSWNSPRVAPIWFNMVLTPLFGHGADDIPDPTFYVPYLDFYGVRGDFIPDSASNDAPVNIIVPGPENYDERNFDGGIKVLSFSSHDTASTVVYAGVYASPSLTSDLGAISFSIQYITDSTYDLIPVPFNDWRSTGYLMSDTMQHYFHRVVASPEYLIISPCLGYPAVDLSRTQSMLGPKEGKTEVGAPGEEFSYEILNDYEKDSNVFLSLWSYPDMGGQSGNDPEPFSAEIYGFTNDSRPQPDMGGAWRISKVSGSSMIVTFPPAATSITATYDTIEYAIYVAEWFDYDNVDPRLAPAVHTYCGIQQAGEAAWQDPVTLKKWKQFTTADLDSNGMLSLEVPFYNSNLKRQIIEPGEKYWINVVARDVNTMMGKAYGAQEVELKKTGLSSGAIVGIIFGVVFGVALIGGAIYFLVDYYKKKTNESIGAIVTPSEITPVGSGHYENLGDNEF